MSALAHIFCRLPVSRRTYSSFGGGRFFNSSKPPKTPVVATKSKSDHSDSTSKDSPSAAKAPQPIGSAPDAASQEPAHESTKNSTVSSSPNSESTSPYLSSQRSYMTLHPTVSSKDFKIHQFFSLHRPLLLISHPPSIFESPPADTPLFRSLASLGDRVMTQVTPSLSTSVNLDGTYGSSAVDGDAETARQLHHAITITRAGATIDWEETLKVLGIDTSQEPERIKSQEQWDREWEEAMMDSTKRKRKKKMKKHK